ncbi:MAG: hypothetical protein A2V66_10225 [Ignavibacteria bacterium RBG_13_36_8]|nr:MAG: hypothetical protein A2V66_10225 [Ignavibacteria bacterium RBG_13_36_8]
MKNLSLIIVLLVSFLSTNTQVTDKSVQQKISCIENGLIEVTSLAEMFDLDSAQLADRKTLTERMTALKVFGVSIVVVNNYQLEWAKAYGTININSGVPVTTESYFEAASTSKLLTAVIVLYLVEKEKLSLDEDVNNYLKSWKVPENKFTKDEKVTLRRLLTHQAGLPMTNFNYDENIGYPTLIDVLNGALPALNKPAILEAIPGSRWMYSNVGYDVIQLLIEDVTGKPFAQAAEEIIFQPLEMNNSTFIYPLNEEQQKREAFPHDEEGACREPAMHLTALAHGGLMTTPTDLAKFTVELMLSYKGKSGKILSQQMTKQLVARELDLDPNILGTPVSEGLGCFINGEGKDLRFSHPGSNLPGANCWLMGFPERGLGIFVMTNGAMGELLELEIISAIVNEYSK